MADDSADAEGSDAIDELTDKLQDLVRDASVMQKMRQDIGTHNDTATFRARLKQQREAVADLQRRCQSLLQTPVNPSLQAKKQRLQAQFKDISAKIQQLQRLIAQEESKHVERDEETGFKQEEASIARDAIAERQRVEQVVNVDELRVELYDIKDKNVEVKELETDVVELSEAFVDLNKIVTEQQEGLDSMENYTEKAVYNTEKGVEDLIKANKWAKRSRYKLIIILILIVVVFIVLLFVTSGAGIGLMGGVATFQAYFRGFL